jgi:predicted ATPase/DNA-binding CsgD family transcriptional regulator
MAGTGSPRPFELGRAGITARELEVLRHVVARLSNREIADQLVVSVRTVESHVSALLNKLGVASRRELAARGATLLDQLAAPASGGLPVALNRFVGRTRERGEVSDLLCSARLVTLTGPAGVGKTRLAIEVGRAREPHERGVRVVDLTPVRQGQEVADRLLAALGAAQVPGQAALDTLANSACDRAVLLLLDNCEHLLADCAILVERLLGHWPAVRVVATSREPLGVPGELVYALRPLTVPRPDAVEPADVLASDAAQLLADRAEGTGAGFSVNGTNAAAVAQLCRRLDGLPLALELLAPRLRTFAPDQILARLDDRLSLLTSAAPGVPSRHRTLRRAIDWSFETLSAAERSLFTALAVFPGSFSFDAVEAIGVELDAAGPNVVETLPVLVDRSLVVTVPAGPTNRYRLLETLRDYAREQLDPVTEQKLVERHARYFLQLAERAEPGLRGAEAAKWLARLRAEQDNLAAALEWTVTARPAHALRLVCALRRFWEDTDQRRSGINWAQRALAAGSEPSSARLAALLATAALVAPWDAARLDEVATEVGQLADRLGDERWLALAKLCRASARGYATVGTRRDIDSAEEAITYFRSSGDRWQTANGLQTLSLLQAPEVAIRSLDEAHSLYAAEGDRVQAANCAFMMTYVLVRDLGNTSSAQQLAREALQVFDELGNQHGQAHARSILAEIDYRTGTCERAAEAARGCLQTFRRVADHRCESAMLLLLATVEDDRGEHEAAAKLLRKTLEVAIRGAHARTVPLAFDRLARLLADNDPQAAISLLAARARLEASPRVPHVDRTAELDALRRQVPPTAFDTAWERGARASLDDLIAIVGESISDASLV